jgi:predicted Zn-dependent protease
VAAQTDNNTAFLMLKILLLMSFTAQLQAQNDEQLLSDWTRENEKILTENNNIIPSKWFETECLSLAKKMQFNKLIQCSLFESESINAYVFDNGHVYFSSSLFKQLKNTHQWASILAHENAHIELKHYLKTIKVLRKPGLFFPKTKIKKTLKKHERQADEWARNVLAEYGYDSSQVNYFLLRIKKLHGNKKSLSHLRLSKRINNPQTIEVIDRQLLDHIKELFE